MRSFCFACAALLCVPAIAQEADSADRDYSSELERIAPLSPAAALDSFEVHPDFEMQLVAAEPLVHDPIAMAFDEFGRMYVVEMRGYSEQRDENIGAVRLLEDIDGDGVMDTSAVFFDGLAWPTAVACYDGGVFIGVAPNILYAKDEDGDGRADRVERVFTGFGLDNVQGLLNSFQWGLDNRIHGATSGSGARVARVDEPDAEPLVLRGRDFSFDPRTLDIRAESGGGQHGLSFDDFGRKFVCHNSDHAQMLMYEDRLVARNPYFAPTSARISIAVDGKQADVFRISPIEPWRVVRTRLRVQGIVPGPVEGGGTPAGYFTSATGITVYRGDAWPAAYRGQLILGDVGSNLIHRKTLRAKGLELEADRARPGVEFVASRDIWFRPVQFANAPDGTLYAADMYREVIEHPDSLPPVIKKHLDLTSGNDRGRIWRIAPKGFESGAVDRLADLDSVALVPYLSHRNAWQRETAARLLWERRDVSAADSLQALAKEADWGIARIQALFTLDGLGELDEETLLAAINDDAPWVRARAVKLAGPFVEDSPEVTEGLVRLAYDADARVRYEAAFAAAALLVERRIVTLAGVLKQYGGDKWMRVATLSGLAEGSGEVFLRLIRDEAFLAEGFADDVLSDLASVSVRADSTRTVERCVEAIENLPDNSSALRDALAEVFLDADAEKMTQQGPVVPQVSAEKEEVLTRLRPALEQDGMAQFGQMVFQERCASCHSFDDSKAGLAPDLRSTMQRGRESVLANVIDPNAEVYPGFVAYAVNLKDGNVLTGVLLEESANAITIGTVDGTRQTVLRVDVEEIWSQGVSLMPEGLFDDLTVEDVADLLAYIESEAAR